MDKALVLLILGFVTVFVHVDCVTCPEDDESSQSTYYPHESQCGLFYECVAGRATLLQCPEGLYWNQRLTVCDWNVNCGVLETSTASTSPPTTTTPVPTDSDDDGGDTPTETSF